MHLVIITNDKKEYVFVTNVHAQKQAEAGAAEAAGVKIHKAFHQNQESGHAVDYTMCLQRRRERERDRKK